MSAFSMHDNSILSTAAIEAKIRDAENYLKSLARIEEVIGRLGIDYECVRLNFDSLRREWEIPESERKLTRTQLFAK